MSIEENKAIVRRITEEAMNNRNLALVDELVAADCVYEGGSVALQGSEGFKKLISGAIATFPDYHKTIKDIVAEGDKVWIYCITSGTHQGDFMGVAATGKPVTFINIRMYRIAGGKIVAHSGVSSNHEVLQQIGVLEYTPG